MIFTPLLTLREIAKATGFDASSIKRWKNDGSLPSVKIGKRLPHRVRDNRPVRFKIEDVAKFFDISVDDILRALNASRVDSGVEK